MADIEIMGDEVELVYPSIKEDKIDAFWDKILDEYGSYSGPELSAMTHQKGTGWYEGSNGQQGDGSVILRDDMIQEIS